MGIGLETITAAQALKIINLQEGHFGDVKAIEISPAKLTRHLSAFANAEGGDLYIGIDEDNATKQRRWRGFATPEAANNHIAVFEQFFPLGQHLQYSFLGAPRLPGYVLQITVSKTPDVKLSSEKIAYVRRNAQSLPVDTAEKIARLNLDKGITSFESSTVACEKDVLTTAATMRTFMSTVVPTAEPEPWLKKVRLIVAEKPTVAGVVLFADDPQSILPKRCSVKVYQYATKDEAGSRETLVGNPLTIEGPLYDQIFAAVKETKRLIEGIQKLGPAGFEHVEYPDETLHEIITNAVLHRDYNIADDVHVRVFVNRVEVESPGRLPGHVTVENILDERFARNGSIVRWINRFPNPPNKDVGEGLNTAFSAMTKLRLRTPEIQQKEYSVIVYIRHEPLASHETIVIDYLKNHPGETITNGKVRELCFIKVDWIARRVLRDLEKRRMIERVPGTSRGGTVYRLPTGTSGASGAE